MLKLNAIVKNYLSGENEVQALRGINLEFRANEFVAILGHSGCGKTTMLNIIGGLDRYTSGDLLINGVSTKNYRDQDWDSYRNHSIGFVFQNYNLIHHLSVLKNVELALTLSGVSKEERTHRAKEALSKVGLETQYNKLPNQLSGGQMQRVAIARALVNNPEILLADEPTGALDTTTSLQIMDLLKEIAHDRLVIMVTHNPTLAERYATRIIQLVDGEVTSDSDPYQETVETKKVEKEESVKSVKKSSKGPHKKATAMSFFTALGLSFRNLITKKGRTILTAFAGSIGIIGIALVLSLSNGFTEYISRFQSDTMGGYPLTISDSAFNIESMMSSMNNEEVLEKYPEVEKIFKQVSISMASLQRNNKLTDTYLEYVMGIESKLHNGIVFEYNNTLNVFRPAEVDGKASGVRVTTSSWNAILDDDLGKGETFVKSQYDIIAGAYPSSYNEIVLVVDEYNRLSDTVLSNLGFDVSSDVDSYDFSQIVGVNGEGAIELKLLTSNEMYKENNDIYASQLKTSSENIRYVEEETYNAGITLKVVGILRAKEQTSIGSVSTGVAYLTSLEDQLIKQNLTAPVVVAQKANKAAYDAGTSETLTNVTTGRTITETMTSTIEAQYMNLIRTLGASEVVQNINIYPVDFASKEVIKDYLDEYNKGKADEDQVIYTDTVEMLLSVMNTMVDAISYVLIAFTAISLVVSSIMIGIITYVSVIERTKEIGILRSIGARKKDITRVFNAETFIIGLTAGLLGVIIAMLLTIPINILLQSLLEGIGELAKLNILHALVLVVISVILTLISGLVPARIASKKDPVEALRTE